VTLTLCYLDLLEFKQVPLIDVSALAAVLSARVAEPPACDCSQHVHFYLREISLFIRSPWSLNLDLWYVRLTAGYF